MYRYIIKPLLFLLPPDWVHFIVVKFSAFVFNFGWFRKIISRFFVYQNTRLEKEFFGIKFKNPIGLGGGFDKDAELINCMPSLGFGFMEVGSITAQPYGGNKRPWNVRLPKNKAIIVNYGLKNKGVDHAVKNLQRTKHAIPIIANIAKTNNPNIKGEASVEDYFTSFKKLEPVADLINLNISCPNTGDGCYFCEDLNLLKLLLEKVQAWQQTSIFKRPILLKLKPDLTDEQLINLLYLVKNYNCIKGFVISNLTNNRSFLSVNEIKSLIKFPGGISGLPAKNLANQMIKKVRQIMGKNYLIIGLGGIFNAQDAYEKLNLGADLVELVTGFIYEGPMVIKQINQGLAKML